MSFIPIMKYIITLPTAGLFYVILTDVLIKMKYLAWDSPANTLLWALWILIPVIIMFAAGIRGIILYKKSRYEQL